jgi:hypothetical protein
LRNALAVRIYVLHAACERNSDAALFAKQLAVLCASPQVPPLVFGTQPGLGVERGCILRDATSRAREAPMYGGVH